MVQKFLESFNEFGLKTKNFFATFIFSNLNLFLKILNKQPQGHVFQLIHYSKWELVWFCEHEKQIWVEVLYKKREQFAWT